MRKNFHGRFEHLSCFQNVALFQFYVFLKLDDSEFDAEEIDKQRRDEERKRRNDLLMKALSAF